MFEYSLVEQYVTKKPGALAISFLLQVAVVIGMLLLPLINYYDIPVTELSTFLVAPPPPPPPPPPPAEVVKPKKVIPKEFDAGVLTQPKKIPEKVAIIEEDSTPISSGPGVFGGVPTGTPGGNGDVLTDIISNVPSVVAPPPAPVVKKVPPPSPQRIRVGGAVQKARMLRQVQPQYPQLARNARIQGTVRLSAIIGKDGSIQELQVLDGHPLLIPAAIQAVKEWRYKPTLLNGQAVEVSTQIDVNFTLSG